MKTLLAIIATVAALLSLNACATTGTIKTNRIAVIINEQCFVVEMRKHQDEFRFNYEDVIGLCKIYGTEI